MSLAVYITGSVESRESREKLFFNICTAHLVSSGMPHGIKIQVKQPPVHFFWPINVLTYPGISMFATIYTKIEFRTLQQ